MAWKNKLISILITSSVLVACSTGSKDANLKFESVSDSLYNPGSQYKETSILWKKYYEDCMFQQVMPNAFYLQLQDKIYIGSINNENELVVNKGINLIDTTNKHEISSLLALIGSGNCRNSTLPLNAMLKQSFFAEIQRILNTSPRFKNITTSFDTSGVKIQTGSLYHTTLRLDSLIRMLNTTKDSSYLRFRDLLLEPENVILGQAVELFGFEAEFPLKTRLAPAQETALLTEKIFIIDNPNEDAGIQLLPGNILRIRVNKRYTVMGRFFKLMAQ